MSSGIQVTEALASLRQWLKSTPLPLGSRLPSERALAAELGLTHYSVNRAMARLIDEGAVERDGYKLRLPTRAPSAEPRLTCELVLSKRSIYFPTYRKVGRDLGIDFNIHRWESAEEALAMLQTLNNPRTQIIVFDPPLVYQMSMWEPIAESLTRNGVPLVCCGQALKGVTSVVQDSERNLGTAVSHLRDLGHLELALVCPSPRFLRGVGMRESWERFCREYGYETSMSRIFFSDSTRFHQEDARDLAEHIVREWPKVTGIVMKLDMYPFEYFVEELAHLGRHVPRDLSLVSTGYPKSLMDSSQITQVDSDPHTTQELAFRMAQRLMRIKESIGILPAPTIVRVQPQLQLRASTATAPDSDAAIERGSRSNPVPPPFQAAWEGSPAELRKELQLAWQRPYPLALRSPENQFSQVNLRPHVNRPLNFRRGWLGDLPLKHFATGRHIIHGVPFEVLGGTSRADCGAVVFQSTINATGKSRKLPSRLRIPIERPAQAIYFLHGCGYAKYLHEFADYSFHSGKKQIDHVPLITLGQPTGDMGEDSLDDFKQRANIQDWWPDFPHIDFVHARMAPIVENEGEETLPRHVYLYTLEWVNPRPELPVSHIEISVDITRATTLGLLAVSVLSPREV